jgi:nucleoside-diphosphate-sugar epimerase
LKKRNKILVVGGTGFIGYHLAKKALEKNWIVVSISTNKPKKKRFLKRVSYIICDISNKRVLERKIKGNFDYVVNLGGYVDHSNKSKTFKSHYVGCKNLAEIFSNKKILSFVQMGSSIEYGNQKSPHKEKNKCDLKLVRSTYGKAKLLSTIYLLDLFKKKKFPSTILRLYLSYGPKQDINRFLPIIIQSCINKKKFPCSAGNQLRDFVHVDDVVNAILKSLNNKNSNGEIINIGTGKPQKIKDIIKLIKKKIKGGHPQFGKIKLRKDEILKMYPDISKAMNIIKWEPKISFEKGLKHTIRSYYD